MAGPQTAKSVTNVGSNFNAIAIVDANGNLAMAMTTFYQTPAGLIVPAPADSSGNPLQGLTIRSMKPVTFHTVAAVAETGQTVQVSGYKTLAVEVFGASSAAGLLTFQGASTSGNYVAVKGKRVSDNATSTSTANFPSGTPLQPDIWQFDVSGLVSFECPLLAITAGTITVQGNLMP